METLASDRAGGNPDQVKKLPKNQKPLKLFSAASNGDWRDTMSDSETPGKCYKLIPLKKSGSTRGTRLGSARDAVTGFD